MSIVVKTIPVGMLQTNCYILVDEATNDAAIVDPGAEAKRIMNIVKKNKWDVKQILLTHGHYDHIMDVDVIREAYDAKIVIHSQEEEYLYNPELSLMSVLMNNPKSIRADELVEDGDEIKLGDSILKVIKVPGHTRASVCYYCQNDKLVIAGDTLFRDGIGRTDLYNGNPNDLVRNIKEKLLVLPDEVAVYPGHGPSTKIGYEKMNNPFL